MYAVIETGGKQYRVTPGETVQLETAGGRRRRAGRIRPRAGGGRRRPVKTGVGRRRRTSSRAPSPSTAAATKIIVFKFKRKKQYKRTIGHRQNYTRVQVNEISA